MRHLVRLPLRYSQGILWMSLFVTIGLALFIPRLHVSTDRNLLAGKDSPAFLRREEVSRLFGTSMVSVAVVEAKTQVDANRVARVLAKRLRKHSAHIRDVFYKADLSVFEKNALLFAPVETVEKVVALLNSSAIDLSVIKDAKSPAQLIDVGVSQLENMTALPEQSADASQKGLAAMESVLLGIADWFRAKDPAPTLLPVSKLRREFTKRLSLPEMNDADGFFTASDNRAPYLAIVFIQPASNSQAMEVVAPLTDLIRENARKIARDKGVNILVTGMPSLATDELRLVTRDCVVAGVIAGVGVLLVFLLAFKSFRVTLFLVLPLGAGLIWAAGFTGLVYAHLTMITSYFAAVLFGLGVAFTIHIVSRFHESLLNGESKEIALEHALIGAGPGVIVGALTTAFAFLAIVFSDFQGFAEMGVISGVGVIMILIANLTLLPAALLRWHPGIRVVIYNRFFPAVNIKARWLWLAGAFVLFTVGIAVSPRIRFNYAVESMLPTASEAVRGIETLNRRTPFSSTFSITTASSLAEADKIAGKFKKLSTVSMVESAAMFIPLDQPPKLSLLSSVRPEVQNELSHLASLWRRLAGAPSIDSRESLRDAMDALHFVLKDLAFDAKRTGRPEAASLERLASAAKSAAKAIRVSSEQRIKAFHLQFSRTMAQVIEILTNGVHSNGFSIHDLPQTIRARYVSSDNKHFAVIIYPNGDIGQKSFFYKHVDELLSVDSNVTGHPVSHLAFTKMIQKGFFQAVLLSAAAVLLLVLLDLRNLTGILIALAPVLLAASWTALLMFFANLQFNYANLMGVPIFIGTSVDYGVHLAHRLKQSGDMGIALRTTGRAIILSGVTTLIGFGSLLAGNHWGVKSLGILLVSGIAFALFATMGVLPLIFRKKRTQ
ncbi:MAG: MMPL family transporter [Deltaproteobacteria bacterium]|nr:MMPL family transporter [Deltaproteobacteria bacterium]